MPELVYSENRHRQELAETSDRELLLALAKDDEAALDQLIRRKTPPILRLALRIVGNQEDARDVAQLTFLRVWENRSRFDDHYSPNTWIYRIATNLAIDHLRSRRSRERTHEPFRHHLQRVSEGRRSENLEQLQEKEIAVVFQRLARELSEKQRIAFTLRELEGLSTPEVARIMGCRQSTVRNHLFNARRTLRRELLRLYPEYAGRYAEGEP